MKVALIIAAILAAQALVFLFLAGATRKSAPSEDHAADRYEETAKLIAEARRRAMYGPDAGSGLAMIA